MEQMEAALQKSLHWFGENRRFFFWLITAILFCGLMIAVKELTALLLLSYVIALLIDPLVNRWERWHIPRGLSVIILGFVVVVFLMVVFGVVLPRLVMEYGSLVANLPSYLSSSIHRVHATAQKLHLPFPADVQGLITWAQSSVSAISVEQIRNAGEALMNALLQGYSFTLTLFNLILLPFFVFYLSRDLHSFHRHLGEFIRDDIEQKIDSVSGEILGDVRAFFKGQMTVAAILACLYAAGLALIGLPSGLIVGALSGLLNIVPYLGVAVGVTLASMIALVTDGTFSSMFLVWAVYAAVNAVDAMFITPRIVGQRLGIHPMAVIVALIIGGKLLGLLGCIIAIPAAAALRVVFQRAHATVKQG